MTTDDKPDRPDSHLDFPITTTAGFRFVLYNQVICLYGIFTGMEHVRKSVSAFRLLAVGHGTWHVEVVLVVDSETRSVQLWVASSCGGLVRLPRAGPFWLTRHPPSVIPVCYSRRC